MTVLETIEKQTAREVLGAFDKYLHAIANDEGKAELVDVPADRSIDYCMTCADNGLEGIRICAGDTLYIHTQDYAETGQVVIASIDRQPPIIRKVTRNDKGLLLYAGAEYDPILVPPDEMNRVEIYGRVVQVAHDIIC